MSLIILYLGGDSSRHCTEEDAKKSGSANHTKSKPARIEITPEGGGAIFSMEYEEESKQWIPDTGGAIA